MSTTTQDLWPEDIFTTPSATPIAILRQQGEALGARTHNFVHGEVETNSDPNGRAFEHVLYLTAPLLRYRKKLLSVWQAQPLPYPATVVEGDLTKSKEEQYWSAPVKNEQELQERLREFFNEPRVKEILRSVINMSNDVVPAEDTAN